MRNNNVALGKPGVWNKNAFTLAEMMVVMLILSIIMAAFAPIITRRNKIESSTKDLWSLVDSSSGNIYRSAGGDNQSVLIGDKITSEGLDSKLIINAESSSAQTPHNQIRLEYGKKDIANIQATDKPALLIGKAKPGTTLAQDSISIGLIPYGETDKYVGNGQASVAIGNGALSANTSGSMNIAVGYETLMSNTTGASNIAFGNQALYTNTTGNYNTASGSGALYSNTTGSTNTAMGDNALYNNTTGSYNTAIGANALSSAKTANNNIAIGYNALNGANTGGSNVAIGQGTLSKATTADTNVAIGENAMQNITGGGSNVAIGQDAMAGSGSPVKNDYNIAIGASALENISASSSYNTAIGYRACYNLVNASNKTCIGYNSGPSTAPTGESRITYIGGEAEMSNTSIYAYGRLYAYSSTVNVISDRRLKNVKSEYTSGLSKLQQLKVYNFTFKSDKSNEPHVGVIAQDLQKIFPNSVIKDDEGYYSIHWDEMFYAMVNSIKELSAKIANLDSRLNKLEKEHQDLEKQSQMLDKRLTALEKKVK